MSSKIRHKRIKNGKKDLRKSPRNVFCPINPRDIREGLTKTNTNEITVSRPLYIVCHSLGGVPPSQNCNTTTNRAQGNARQCREVVFKPEGKAVQVF